MLRMDFRPGTFRRKVSIPPAPPRERRERGPGRKGETHLLTLADPRLSWIGPRVIFACGVFRERGMVSERTASRDRVTCARCRAIMADQAARLRRGRRQLIRLQRRGARVRA